MYHLPPEQAATSYSGTFVLLSAGVLLGSIDTLAPADWMAIGLTGTTAYVDGADSMPPLAWGGTGTVAMTYTANLGVDTYEGVSGAFCAFEAKASNRDYLVLVCLEYRFASANFAFENIRIVVNGSPTGIFPTKYNLQKNAVQDQTNVFLHTYAFVLPNWTPGTYTIQLQHTPDSASVDRAIRRAIVAVI
jgi:hypothetical protein